MKKYVAFFDLDKTIIDVNSARYIALFAQKYNLLSKFDIISGLYYSILYKTGFLSTEALMEIMTKWLKNVDASRLKQLFNDLGRYLVETKIRQKAKEAIDFHHRQGAKTVILSASVKDVCAPVRDYLKIDDVICTEMELNGGIYTGKVSGNYCYGEEKLQRVNEYCQQHQFNFENAWYYADSISDLSVLSAIGYPVCVTPDRKLEKHARKMGWPVESW
jgi:HAD superfamily hydrolase (TIGR01490 family)